MSNLVGVPRSQVKCSGCAEVTGRRSNVKSRGVCQGHRSNVKSSGCAKVTGQMSNLVGVPRSQVKCEVWWVCPGHRSNVKFRGCARSFDQVSADLKVPHLPLGDISLDNVRHVCNQAPSSTGNTHHCTILGSDDSTCWYDSIRIYNWFDGNYRQVSRFCGSTIPTSVTFQDGVGLVLFKSDYSVAKTGFDFQYE
ncbi:Procollagen C-endopeptidase enhancer 1 [Folsomia candida]|uniref:Procollagen C-endopeptidase enhancer 1 n=1 Tax=Folsomia candida TaxID=158441 RepID=A0A226EZQ8_FOLCA|nr:Procollagen C-endopeptidase enhancer 1 [Folsomia candida]